jgi:hypothetical protein
MFLFIFSLSPYNYENYQFLITKRICLDTCHHPCVGYNVSLSLSLSHTHTHTHTCARAKHLSQFPLCLSPPGTYCKVGGNHRHALFITIFDAHMTTVLRNDLVLTYLPSLNSFNTSFLLK